MENEKKIVIFTSCAKRIVKSIVQFLSRNVYIVVLDYRHTVTNKSDFN